MKRLNLGCGVIQPTDWINVDLASAGHNGALHLDVLDGVTVFRHQAMAVGAVDLDYVVANHMLSDLGHHDLVPALRNIRLTLKPGGVLRVLVPDVLRAFRAFQLGSEDWFPQDERTGGLDAKFCTFVTWYGTARSVFTYDYLVELLEKAGFVNWSAPLACGVTRFGSAEIVELDDRCTEALIVEAVK